MMVNLLAVPGHLRSYTCILRGLANISKDTFLVAPTERCTEIFTSMKCLVYFIYLTLSNNVKGSIAG